MSVCPKCGDNIEISKLGDGSILFKKHCQCEFTDNDFIRMTYSSDKNLLYVILQELKQIHTLMR